MLGFLCGPPATFNGNETDLIMSNSLISLWSVLGWLAAQVTTAPTTAPAAVASDQGLPPGTAFVWVLTGVGGCILLFWAARRISERRRLTLAGTPGRPNRLSVVTVGGSFLLYFAWSAGTAYLLHQAGFKVLNDRPEPTLYLALLGVSAVWVTLNLLLARWAFRGGIVRGLGLSTRHWLADSIRAVIGCLAALPPVMLALVVTTALLPEGFVPKEHTLLEALPGSQWYWKIVLVFSAVVVAPLAEEIFFRGLLQSMIRSYTQRPWVAVVAAAVIFGGVHAEWQNVPALIILGIALGYNYERTGRLLPAILIHALFNGIMVTAALMDAGVAR
jgi:membrane protease YdiL (CAAX protease family)